MWSVWMHWLQRKYLFKPHRLLSLLKIIVLFGGFPGFFWQLYVAKSWGFLHYNQCFHVLHLSYQTPPYNDMPFFGLWWIFLKQFFGKNTVFLLSRKINSAFKKNWMFQIILKVTYLYVGWKKFIQIFYLNFCHPKHRPTTLQSYLTYHV